MASETRPQATRIPMAPPPEAISLRSSSGAMI